MRTVAAAVAVLALAGCGSTTHTVVKTVTRVATVAVATTATAPFDAAVPPSGEPCDVYARDTGAYIIVSGQDSGAVCVSITRKWSGSGIFWSRFGERSQGAFVCRMTHGDTVIDVYDTGGQTIGQNACSTLAQNGWTEQPG